MVGEGIDTISRNTTSQDYDNKYYICGICSPVCSVVFVATLILLELIYLNYELIVIQKNDYFDNKYGLVFFFLMLPFIFSIVIFVIFFFNYKDQGIRERLPEAFLVAAITNFLIALWIIIYISAVYDDGSVAVERKLYLGPK